MTQPPDDAALVARLRQRLPFATPLPWMVQDGCSWRRIGTRESDGDVLCPTVHHRDGHPDLIAADGKVYANLALIVDAVNALPGLLDALEAKDRRIEMLEAALAPFSKQRPHKSEEGSHGILVPATVAQVRIARAALEPSDKGVG